MEALDDHEVLIAAGRGGYHGDGGGAGGQLAREGAGIGRVLEADVDGAHGIDGAGFARVGGEA